MAAFKIPPDVSALYARYREEIDPDGWSRDCAEFAHTLGELQAGGLTDAQALQAMIKTRRKPPKGVRLMRRRASSVTPEMVSWLWPAPCGRSGYLARGKVSLFSGDPGLGKSWALLDVAARISSGAELPGKVGNASAGNVLILSAEDAAEDTIVPRLTAAGADLDRVHLLEGVKPERGSERSFKLTEDLALLDAEAEEVGDVALVVVDPISAYLGKTDSHNNADMRGVLAPLAALASRRRFALAAVTHLNKGRGSALHRITGSIALPAVARVSLTVLEDPSDPTRRLLMGSKSNIGRKEDLGLSYRIVGDPPRIEWGPKDPRTPDEIMLAAEEATAKRTAQRDAEDWLSRVLADGAVAATDVISRGKTEGFSERTLSRALDSIGESRKCGMGGGWQWSLKQ